MKFRSSFVSAMLGVALAVLLVGGHEALRADEDPAGGVFECSGGPACAVKAHPKGEGNGEVCADENATCGGYWWYTCYCISTDTTGKSYCQCRTK